jgi:hypothetical protein
MSSSLFYSLNRVGFSFKNPDDSSLEFIAYYYCYYYYSFYLFLEERDFGSIKILSPLF